MDGYVTIGTELDTKSFDAQIDYVKSQLDEIEYKLKQADMGFEVGDVQKLEAEYEKLTDKLGKLVQKKQELNRTDFTQIKTAIDNVGNSVEKVTKKVGRWALAVFGIRSAYLFVRQAMSTLSQYDDQMAVNIQYIRYLLASSLKPVIETIINLAYKLLTYINYISQAWFGVNLFANASTKAFEKQNKALGGSVKQAKQLQKTLAGFDEMNVLQENGNVGAGGGTGGAVTLPNFPKMEDIEIPGWIKWIAEHKDEVIGVLLGIAGGLTAIKLGLGPLKALGIGIVLFGIYELVKDIIKFIKDPSWKNFINILTDIGIIIGGVMLIMGNWWGLLVVIIAGLIKLIINNWDTIKGVLGSIGKWILNNVINPIVNFFATGINTIVKLPVQIKNAFVNAMNGIYNIVSSIWNKIKNLFNKGGKIFVGITEGIAKIFKTMINAIITGINKVISVPFNKVNNLLNTIRNVKIPVINKKPFKGLWGANPLPVPKIPKLAKGGIINQPGRGVYTGSAIAGESGKELYMPLQDEQMLSLVGESIGRHIVVNLTSITQLDGRQIARKVEQINNNNRFVLNR